MGSSRCSTFLAIGLFGLISLATSAFGSDVEVFVVDRDGRPVADVAVYAARSAGLNQLPAPTSRAVMDQIDKQFVPHLLVVQTGTPVEFPNSDSVAHHVYSFSHPNKFKLPMYKGTAHPPVTFEHSGVVILGCNIHDHMLGYILVVDSTIFAMTDEDGKASLSLDVPTDYVIRIWSPRIRDREEFLSMAIANPDSLEPSVRFQLAKKLSPPHGEQLASWQDY
jgi:plastocyanin